MAVKIASGIIQIVNTFITKHPIIEVKWLGRIGYQEAWDLQNDLLKHRLAGEISDTLLLLEHPPTITLGRGAEFGNIVANADTLERLGVTVIETNRGGDVTYHGPGQLVGYPIFKLDEDPHKPDLHLYLRNLEEVLIRALRTYGIEGARFPGYTGVWTDMNSRHTEKVAAIGIRTSRWITQHGFALNVCTNLEHFDLIVPCGITDYGVTSLTKLLETPVEVTNPIPEVIKAFEQVFQLPCRYLDTL